jgi:predicted nucleic acid-binding protein
VTPSFVIDASLALAWCFQDEATPATKALLIRMDNEAALVPSLWYVEIINVLAIAERKNRINQTKILEFISLIGGFDLEIDRETADHAFTHILSLCRTYQLSSYDAVYLDLALRRHLPLATLDDPLKKAAKSIGVNII